MLKDLLHSVQNKMLKTNIRDRALLITVCFLIALLISSAIVFNSDSAAKKTSYMYDECSIKQQGMSKPTRMYTEYNLMLLAKLLEAENGSASDECIYMTGVVVLKRVKAEGYPDTIRDVIYQKGQYSTAKKLNSIEPSERCLEIAEELLIYGVDDYPDKLVFQSMFPQGSKTYAVLDGEYFCLAR